MASAPVFTGAEAMIAKLEAIAQKVPDNAARSLFQQGQVIMGASKRLVPVDTGALRSTGTVERPVIKRGDVSVTLAFGGPAEPYAAAVHENLNARHPVGQAKYLEQPVLEAMPTLAGDLGKDILKGT